MWIRQARFFKTACLILLLAWAPSCASGLFERRDYGTAPNGELIRPLTGQYVLLVFWSRQCERCMRELRIAEALSQAMASSGQLVVIAVNQTDPTETVRELAVRNQTLTMSLAFDPQGRLARRFGVEQTPTLVLADPSGRRIWMKSGYPEESAEALMQRAGQLVLSGEKGGLGRTGTNSASRSASASTAERAIEGREAEIRPNP